MSWKEIFYKKEDAPTPRWVRDVEKNLKRLVPPFLLAWLVSKLLILLCFLIAVTPDYPFQTEGRLAGHWLTVVVITFVVFLSILAKPFFRIWHSDKPAVVGLFLFYCLLSCMTGFIFQSTVSPLFGRLAKGNVLPAEPTTNYYSNPGLQVAFEKSSGYVHTYQSGKYKKITHYDYYQLHPILTRPARTALPTLSANYYLLTIWEYAKGEKMSGFHTNESSESFRRKADSLMPMMRTSGVIFYEWVTASATIDKARLGLPKDAPPKDTFYFLQPHYEQFEHRANEMNHGFVIWSLIVLIGGSLGLAFQKVETE